jgi:photosystem II stability/assembly factor-like uncharacterized protein
LEEVRVLEGDTGMKQVATAAWIVCPLLAVAYLATTAAQPPDFVFGGTKQLTAGDDRVPSNIYRSVAAGDSATSWVQTNGPEGGYVANIAPDPSNPNLLYAAGLGGAVFRSTDAGEHWEPLGQILHPSEMIHDILVSAQAPTTLYALAGALYKSTDGGASWSVPAADLTFSCITMGLSDSSRMAAGTHDGKVYRSTDGGESWAEATGNLSGDQITDIALGADNEIWVGTAAGGRGRLYQSTNNGDNWQSLDIGQRSETDILSIFVDPENTRVVYVGLQDVNNRPFNRKRQGKPPCRLAWCGGAVGG